MKEWTIYARIIGVAMAGFVGICLIPLMYRMNANLVEWAVGPTTVGFEYWMTVGQIIVVIGAIYICLLRTPAEGN